MKSKVLVLALCLALFASVLSPFSGNASAAAPAMSHTQSHPAFLDKTRFVLHMGAAYFAFHHFVYARWKSGGFAKGSPHRISNLIKAAIALLFAYHEVKVSYGIAQKSNSKILHAIIAPLNALGNAFNSIAGRWKKGQYSDSDISSLTSQTGSVSSLASKAGWGFHDIPVTIPGA